MKVLQINKYFYPKGGAETVFFNTIDLLQSHGHEVIPFCLKSAKNKPSKHESYFVDYPELSEVGVIEKITNIPNFIHNKKAAILLEKLILAEKPDIAHIHLLFNSLSVSILPILKKYNIPTVMSVHDYRLICPAYTFRDGNGNICEQCKDKQYIHCTVKKCSKKSLINSFLLSVESYYRQMVINPLDYIDKFIFVSQFALNKHVEFTNLYKNKAEQIYNFTPYISEINKQTAKEQYLLYFGRLSYEKGIETLLDAMRNIPNLQLKVIGTGPLLNSLKENHPKNVEFLGFKYGDELKQYIQNAFFTIVPSEWYENNPLSIIESFSFGTPVIGANIGGIPELIKEGLTGYLFKSGVSEDLVKIIKKAGSMDNDQYGNMSSACLKFAHDNFSAETHYKQLTEVYQSLVKKKV